MQNRAAPCFPGTAWWTRTAWWVYPCRYWQGKHNSWLILQPSQNVREEIAKVWKEEARYAGRPKEARGAGGILPRENSKIDTPRMQFPAFWVVKPQFCDLKFVTFLVNFLAKLSDRSGIWNMRVHWTCCCRNWGTICCIQGSSLIFMLFSFFKARF